MKVYTSDNPKMESFTSKEYKVLAVKLSNLKSKDYIWHMFMSREEEYIIIPLTDILSAIPFNLITEGNCIELIPNVFITPKRFSRHKKIKYELKFYVGMVEFNIHKVYSVTKAEFISYLL